jgi:hypothetical protein
VILEGWKPEMLKVALTKLIRAKSGKGLAEAKQCTDDVLAGKPVTLPFATAADADIFSANAQQLGVLTKRDTRFQ